MQRLKVLRKIRFNTLTIDDALFIRLHINVGHPVKVSDYDYHGLYFDKSVHHDLRDIELQPNQVLNIDVVRREGFRGIDKSKKHGYVFCYVLEDEDKIDASGEWIMPPPTPDAIKGAQAWTECLKEDKNMEVMNGNFMQQMIGMKMLKNVFDSDAKDINIGKLMMMQQVLGGSAIQVTDVIKAKIMEQFALDDKNVDDLPLEKLLLLQMLDKGSIDIQQLIQFKMMNKMLEEDL